MHDLRVRDMGMVVILADIPAVISGLVGVCHGVVGKERRRIIRFVQVWPNEAAPVFRDIQREQIMLAEKLNKGLKMVLIYWRHNHHTNRVCVIYYTVLLFILPWPLQV